MIPVPGHTIGTPYGRRGSWWSCDEDSAGNGIHTGVDYPAAVGTLVVAARPGTVHHCDHGSAFGDHQIEVTPGDGTRDFYAHLRSRVPDGTRVAAGDKVGEVGAEGNVSGPHLHFERHQVASGGWSCSIVTDPAPSINYAQETDMELDDQMNEWSPDDGDTGKITVGQTLNQARGYSEDTYQRLKKLQGDVDDLADDVALILKKLG
jgi:murein DD-endopeptidase MepM/ murein hydrolase activator NlpD